MSDFDKVVGNVHIELNTTEFKDDIDRAQKLLDMVVLKDTTEYVPFLQGGLRGSGHILYDGVIEWNSPYAHYQYMGELYLAANGSSWAQKGETKYPAGVPLVYHQPGTTAQWFETAKQLHKDEWIETVKKALRNR